MRDVDAKRTGATILAAALAIAMTATALPPAPVVVDDPLGEWDVDLLGLEDGTPVWNVTFAIHENTGEGENETVLDGCYHRGDEKTPVCGEYAFRVFREASPGGAAVVNFTGDHGKQLDNLDDQEESQAFCDGVGAPACLDAVDPVFGGFAANLCGGPDGDDEKGDAWLHVSAPAGTQVYVGAVYETPENFDGQAPDTESDPCVQQPDDQTDFPGNYTSISFSRTITLN